LSKLKLRWRLFKSKYSSVSGYKRLIVKIAMYLLLLGLAFVFIYPFIYMIVTSLKSDADLNSLSVQWIPTELKFENYFVAIDILKAGRYLKNSLFVTVVASIGHIISCSFIGYGFARFHFPFKKLLFGCVILAFIVPVQTLIIPMYLTYSNLGWLDSYLPLIVPTFFGFGLKGALYVFLFRQFYLTLPRDLENAARIDGCGFLMTYWKIVFPLAQSTLMVALVLSVVWHWNDFYEPAIFVSKARLGFFPPRLTSACHSSYIWKHCASPAVPYGPRRFAGPHPPPGSKYRSGYSYVPLRKAGFPAPGPLPPTAADFPRHNPLWPPRPGEPAGS